MSDKRPTQPGCLTQKMIDGDSFFTDRFVTHLREELGLPLEDIASILVASAGRLLREAIPDEQARFDFINRIAVVAMTGRPIPLAEAGTAQPADLAPAVATVKEALAHLKEMEKAACGRYYFAKKAGAAFQVIEAALKRRVSST